MTAGYPDTVRPSSNLTTRSTVPAGGATCEISSTDSVSYTHLTLPTIYSV